MRKTSGPIQQHKWAYLLPETSRTCSLLRLPSSCGRRRSLLSRKKRTPSLLHLPIWKYARSALYIYNTKKVSITVSLFTILFTVKEKPVYLQSHLQSKRSRSTISFTVRGSSLFTISFTVKEKQVYLQSHLSQRGTSLFTIQETEHYLTS